MKRKIIIIIVSLIICISASILIINNIFSDNSKPEIHDNINKIEEVKENQEELKEENKEQTKNNDDSNKQEIIPEKQEEKQQSTKTTNDTSNNNQKSTTNNTPSQTQHNNESGVVDSSGNSVSENNQITIDNEPWVKAGVSKEDYYTKPVHSWMRVDYSIENGDCNGVSDCEAKCLKDAEERSFTENLSCIQVMTYSGKYIGEMLKKD